MYSIGIDSGSVATKGILYNGKKVVKKIILPTGWAPKETSAQIYQQLIQGISKDNIKNVIGTGYGRINMSFADEQVTEITCHAYGAKYLEEKIDTVLDIGGQDSKVISLFDNGKVKKFVMNDKCAAGTGRFLQETMSKVGIDLKSIDQYDPPSKKITISSMCAVFATSEVVSLLAKGTTKSQIVYGIIDSISSQAINLVEKVNGVETILFTGGLSNSELIRQTIEKKLDRKVVTSEDSQYAGAIGAALLGYK